MDESTDVHPILIVGIRRPEHVEKDWGGGHSPKRIERLLGVKRGHLLEAVDGVNLLGPHDEDTAIRRNTAAEALTVEGRELLILCGDPVHKAFRLGRRDADEGDILAQGAWKGVPTVSLTHPSGRNRKWNKTKMTAMLTKALRKLTTPLIHPGLLNSAKEAERSRTALARAGEWHAHFVKLVRSIGNVAVVAEKVGIGRTTVHNHRKRHPEFDRQIGDAERMYKAWLEVTAEQRALNGVKRPVFYQGDVCGEVVEYDTTLLLKTLAAEIPEKWSERHRHEHSGPGGGPFTVLTLLEADRAAEAQERVEAEED